MAAHVVIFLIFLPFSGGSDGDVLLPVLVVGGALVQFWLGSKVDVLLPVLGGSGALVCV